MKLSLDRVLRKDDFLYYGIMRSVFSKETAIEFVKRVNSQNSRIPEVDFDAYVCDKI